jgi:pimeloyl-ACP methyl ester carboxylesterase
VSRAKTPRLDGLQAALAAGDLDAARAILLELDGEERRLFELGMGSEPFERSRRAAARGRRRGKLGKVLVLPGIMGSELDSVDRSGDADRIWLKFVNLILGRIADFELTPEGEPAKAGIHIRTAGLHSTTYLPILMELDSRWHVRPFAFDWREDIDRSAVRLDAEIKAFGAGEPVHLLTHSMGGLVARRFVHRFRETWQAMDDPEGRGRGGRLVMMGTPNRGSFTIPLVLTGGDKVVRALAKGDIKHSLEEVLATVATFPGMYQMLPSPLVELDGDDHGKLFERASWGDLAVHQPLLDRARAFHADLEEIVDPDRLLYIAGHDRRTPFLLELEAPGKFTYGETREGDGRVPHALGLLEAVKTYWVDEGHGDLPKNGQVLDAIADLLLRGETSVLAAERPATRGTTRRPRSGRREVEPVPAEAERILAKAKRRRRAGGAPDLTPEEEVRLEKLVADQYLGSGEGGEPAGAEAEEAPRGAPTRTRRPAITVEVAWGDVTKIEADVYAVGHYQGVTPQNAELALDCAVSGIPEGCDPVRSRLVITRHTRRGILRGALGDVSYFPWSDPEHRGRLVAVAGMGRPGTFDQRALVRLTRELVLSLGVLPTARTVCVVLIGSGTGTLSIPEAVRGLVRGISEAAGEVASDLTNTDATPIERLIVVEWERSRAFEIHAALQSELENGLPDSEVELRLADTVATGAGGAVSAEEGLALVVESALIAAASPARSRQGRALATLVGEISAPEAVRALALGKVKDMQADRDGAASFDLPHFRVERRMADRRNVEDPVRISFWDDGRAIHVAAIHEAATVPERIVRVDRKLIAELVERTTDPPPEEVEELCDLLMQLLVPSEFHDVLHSGPLVFEVDRSTAPVHWELLAASPADSGGSEPLSVQLPFARQLRTVYSPAPLPRPVAQGKIRALVIGDPGDPATGDSLEGARVEALRVVEILSEREDVEVDARIGAPSVPREGALSGIKPANRLDILSLLLRGEFDLVHYAGHGDFDENEPDRVGWVFAGGLLTPHELQQLERVPSIVVANACLTARTSQAIASAKQGTGEEPRSEAGLLPSLADQFFRLGVRNYVGTAWEVNDVGATLFAEAFYRAILHDSNGSAGGGSFGDAVLAARQVLWRQRHLYGPLWAAYQHYGDPSSDAGLIAEAAGSA